MSEIGMPSIKKVEYRDLADEELYRVSAEEENAEQAFGELISRHLHHMWRIAMNVLGDEKEAEDVVQEVSLCLWNKRGDWTEGSASFSTWLYRVCVNKAIDFRRKKNITPQPVETDVLVEHLDHNQIDSYYESQHTLLRRVESAQELVSAIEKLPTSQKKAVLLFYYRENSISEIATAMGCTEVAVRSLLKRGRQNLKIFYGLSS